MINAEECVVGIIAGEASGDRLAAGLMTQLQQLRPDVRFVGIGGPLMCAAGLQSWEPMERLSVNGFAEPVRRLPELLAILRRTLARMKDTGIDCFIGVDFNVFNLIVAGRLKRAGFLTVHYVSPSVYAWRRGRAARLARSVHTLLTLYPFEPEFYRATGVRTEFVGHPLADAIDLDAGSDDHRKAAKATLGIALQRPVVAVLPGSRGSEVRYMLQPFLQAASLAGVGLHTSSNAADKALKVLIPCVRERLKPLIAERLLEFPDLDVTVLDSDARIALTACDAALVKSGTGTLEAMLLHRPMVVSYRLGELTYRFVKLLLRTPYVALPNILSGKRLVPELLQHQATPEALAAELQKLLAGLDESVMDEFVGLHKQLRRDANFQAAQAVVRLLPVLK